MTFYHDTPNSRFPDFNFFEFPVNALSTTGHSDAILPLQKIPSIYC